MAEKLIHYMYQSWADLDRVTVGLTFEEATTPYDNGSSIAWTVGHVTTQIDSWLNMRIQGIAPHPVFDRKIFRTGGDGRAENWDEIFAGMQDVRARARAFLVGNPAPDLDRTVDYDGAIVHVRITGLSLRYALLTIAAHHFLHVGEITTIRSRLGHSLEDEIGWGRGFL
jgi:hypothetical protein